MVPIHDTDVAEERWSKAEWENYELWEKVELRLRRHRRLWILGTLFLFVVLSAVPIVLDRWPKWATRAVIVKLAYEINQMKRDAGTNRSAYRLRFIQQKSLSYKIEKIPDCSTEQGEVVKSGSFEIQQFGYSFSWINPSQGQELGIPGLANEFCYDYLAGNGAVLKGLSIIGLGIIPDNDLTEKRTDRLSILVLSGPSAEISFD